MDNRMQTGLVVTKSKTEDCLMVRRDNTYDNKKKARKQKPTITNKPKPTIPGKVNIWKVRVSGFIRWG